MTTSTLTTRQAAELAGLAPDRFRSEMTRERKRGRDYRRPAEEWPDARTPSWDAEQLGAWVASRRAKLERLGRA